MMLREKALLTSVSREYRQPHSGWAGKRTGFTHLPSGFGIGKSANPGPAYNTHTCFEFHQLLISTLLGYNKTLNAFARAMSSPGASSAAREKLAQKFWRYYRLLWWLAYSHVLTQHLMMLEAGSFLHLPMEGEKEDYQNYTECASPLSSKAPEEVGNRRHEE